MADELRKCALGHEPRLLGPSKHLNSKYGMWVCCSWPNNETHEITQADGRTKDEGTARAVEMWNACHAKPVPKVPTTLRATVRKQIDIGELVWKDGDRVNAADLSDLYSLLGCRIEISPGGEYHDSSAEYEINELPGILRACWLTDIREETDYSQIPEGTIVEAWSEVDYWVPVYFREYRPDTSHPWKVWLHRKTDGSYLYGTEYRTIRLPKPPGGAG